MHAHDYISNYPDLYRSIDASKSGKALANPHFSTTDGLLCDGTDMHAHNSLTT